MKPQVLAIVLLVVLLSPTATVHAQGPDASSVELAWRLRGDTTTPQTHPLPPFVPRNATFTAWLHIQPATRLDTTLHLTARNATLNRTQLPLTLQANEDRAVPVEVHVNAPLPPTQFTLHARLENTSVNTTKHVGIVPQLRAQFVTPAPRAPGAESMPRWGWNEEVPVRVRLTNPTGDPAGPQVLVLMSEFTEVARQRIQALDPGDSRIVDLGPFQRLDLQANEDPGQLPRDDTRVFTLSLHRTVPHHGHVPLHDHEFPNASRLARTDVFMYRGLHSGVDADITVGEPSRVRATVGNGGGSGTIPLTIEVTVTPWPPFHYGVTARATRSADIVLPPGGNHTLEVGFTPRVGLPHVVHVTYDTGATRDTQRHPIPVPGPLEVAFPDGQRVEARPGEETRVPVLLRSDTRMQDARLGTSVGPPAARATDPVPYRHLLTQSDLFTVRWDPARVTLEPGEVVHANLTLTPHATGEYVVVPTVRSGGVVYGDMAPNLVLRDLWTGELDGSPGALGVSVFSHGAPGIVAWLPLLVVLAGVGGVEAHRRWMVE